MGENTQNMTGAPDPKDTGALDMPENDETTIFQPVGLVEDADDPDEGVKKPHPKWLVPAMAGESPLSCWAPVSADTRTP